MKALKLLLSEPFELFQQSQLPANSPYSSRSMDFEYYNNLGCAYFGLGRYHYASLLFRRAHSYSQSTPMPSCHSGSVQYNLGLALMKSSKPVEAFDCFTNVLKSNKIEEWMIYLRMAECCIQRWTSQANSTKNIHDKSFRLGRRIYQLDPRFQRFLDGINFARLCWSCLSANECEFSMKQARMYLEKALQLLQISQQLLPTSQKTPFAQDVGLEESQRDRTFFLNSVVDFALLNLVFVHISLRDWCRALRVSQRLLLSSSAGEDVMYVWTLS